MEEIIGKMWHRVISRVAYLGFPAQQVNLDDINQSLAVFFRALGGDGALNELAWRDEDTLRLPSAIDA